MIQSAIIFLLALIETEETIKKFVGERSFNEGRSPGDGRDGGNFGRGRGNFSNRGMGRGSRLSMADRWDKKKIISKHSLCSIDHAPRHQ